MRDIKSVINFLKTDGIGVIPTDTLYGLVGSALSPQAVERIYGLRQRDRQKPFIVLIGSITDLEKFAIKLSPAEKEILTKIWPGPVSVVLPCSSPKFKYLHRGTGTIAFRLPSSKPLLKLLSSTGPLVAPSANLEGQKPAETITEAKKYFDKEVLPSSHGVNFYLSAGRRLSGKPSTLVKFDKDGKIEILRQGKKVVKAVSSRVVKML